MFAMPINALLAAALCFASLFFSVAALAAPPIKLEVAKDLRSLLEANLTTLRDDALPKSPDENDRRALVRRTRKEVSGLLATEGYFTPTVTREGTGVAPMTVRVDPGPRAHIGKVDLRFSGAIADTAYAQRRAEIKSKWPLKEGSFFRQADWDGAKGFLLDAVAARDFAAARFSSTRAAVDPDKGTVALEVAIDSGPVYTMGALQIKGLEDYEPTLIRRYNSIKLGEPYDQARLLDFQRVLQSTPYFSSVVVDMPTDVKSPQNVPIQVSVAEARPKRVELGGGFSSNNGYRVETAYRNANWLDRGWQLVTGIRLEQRRQLLYADVFLPPARAGYQDSFGGQFERTDTQGLRTTTAAVGVARHHVRGDIETSLAFKLQREILAPDGAEKTTSKALTANYTWTRRKVDDLFNPRRGTILSGQVGGGTRVLLSDQNFMRLSARAVRYQPVGERDVVIVRGEAGATLAPSRDGIPQEFLFRTGGAQTVRGYAYNSLGVQDGDATVGGRYMAVVSAEYVHWLKESDWGIAAFVDSGDAADERSDLDLKTGYGLGARWRSPAGPIAIDVAYGEAESRTRLHFSVAVAF